MMLRKTVAMGAALALLAAPAFAAQAPGAPPPQPEFTGGDRPGERAAVTTDIPGVIAGGQKFEIVIASFNNYDGIVGTADGGVIFAQEQTHTIRKLEPDGRETVFLADTHGTGAVSLDAKGRLFAVQRTCTDPGLRLGAACQERPMVSQLAPDKRMLANAFADGRSLGRVNDIIADGKGGAYFTQGGAYYASADGKVSVVADKDLRSNGIMLSRDNRTLYVTNNTDVQAFDVQADGSTRNRRTFGTLAGDTGGDGMAIDNDGRLYVTAALGVHVFAPDGRRLGLIPTPRRPISLAFSGSGKRTLYVIQTGAIGPDGKNWSTPEGVRNTAMSLYRIPMVAQGFLSRPK
jgi:gluconolactonase